MGGASTPSPASQRGFVHRTLGYVHTLLGRAALSRTTSATRRLPELHLSTLNGGAVLVDWEFARFPHLERRLSDIEERRVDAGAVASAIIVARADTAHPGSQLVCMTVDDLIVLLGLSRPDLYGIDRAKEVQFRVA